MHIDTIESLERFTEIRANWDAVYDADPEAQFFLSWTWLSKWFHGERQWFVLAVKPDADASEYVAFFPLTLETKKSEGGGFHNNLVVTGHEFADYNGFICTPEFEDRAIPAFAEHIQGLHWTKLKLPNLSLSEGRFRLFKDRFPPRLLIPATGPIWSTKTMSIPPFTPTRRCRGIGKVTSPKICARTLAKRCGAF